MSIPLRVGLDARLVARGLGIATYVRELAGELVRHDDVASLVWFGSREHAPSDPKVRVVPLSGRPYPFLDSGLGARLVARAGVDIMHFAANTGWTRRGPVPAVVTVHDLIFASEHGRGGTVRQRLGRGYMRWNVPRATRSADRLVAVSRSTASDIVATSWGRGAAPRVVHHGVRPPEDMALPPTSAPYFVVFGGADPRKNVALALDAFCDALGALPAGTRLQILAGAGLDPALADRLAGGDIPVDVLGYVQRRELWSRVAGALALIHPTTAEGFGFPVLDAMAVGTPVIGGLTPVTEELAGSALVPLDAARPRASLAAALVAVAREATWRVRLGDEGRLRAAGFSWSRSAAEHVRVYREALAG